MIIIPAKKRSPPQILKTLENSLNIQSSEIFYSCAIDKSDTVWFIQSASEHLMKKRVEQ